MQEEKNILVFPCGTEIGLEVHAALKYEKKVRLFGASSEDDHGRMVYENYVGGMPYVGAPGFDEAFEACVRDNKIDFIIPAHDSAVLYLAENRHKYSARVIAPDAEICHTCRSKRRTYQALAGESFVPAWYESVDDIPAFPVFLKPDVGQGSQGVLRAPDAAAVKVALAANPDLLICEYLPGAEYTVDCYTKADGTLLFVSARERVRTKAGISVRSRILEADPEIEAIARTIGDRLGMRGVWFFQLKRDRDGKLKLMEVAPRVAGAMALHRTTGINFILLSLYEAMGFDVDILKAPVVGGEIERALINRYQLTLDYEAVYFDLDDTLIVNGRVNDHAMMFLYQCKRQGVPVHLITRHLREPGLTLDQFHIHAGLFASIIWITDGSQKSGHMDQSLKAIFVDDAFRERRDVSQTFGWPTFGPDGLEALLDWRR